MFPEEQEIGYVTTMAWRKFWKELPMWSIGIVYTIISGIDDEFSENNLTNCLFNRNNYNYNIDIQLINTNN